MKLTEKEAIKITIELWTYLAETGESHKHRWSGWGKYGKMDNNCPLCEYVGLLGRIDRGCKKCPLGWGKRGCEDNKKSEYLHWAIARTEEDHKKYARAFLEQLKQL